MSQKLQRKNAPYPALEYVLDDISEDTPNEGELRDKTDAQHTTSISLARALSVGCLARLDSATPSVNIWDPAAGSGFAGSLLVNALRSAGVQTHYRGQEINQTAAGGDFRSAFGGLALG